MEVVSHHQIKDLPRCARAIAIKTKFHTSKENFPVQEGKTKQFDLQDKINGNYRERISNAIKQKKIKKEKYETEVQPCIKIFGF